MPVIVQDFETKQVLMLAYMNKEAWEKTLETGKATFFSRSRNSIWVKGEKSGHFQIVKEIFVDCDEDTVLLMVDQNGSGGACHLGYRSCFFRKLENNELKIVEEKVFDPEKVYEESGSDSDGQKA